MAALCLHLDHGVWSMLETLGLNNARINRALPDPVAGRGAGGVRRLHRGAGCRAGRLVGLKESVMLDAKIPDGPDRGEVGPAPLRDEARQPGQQAQYHIIVVGTGLAGASAAATLAELGYNVSCFCFQDSPRRAHSIAAQGGINAAKNYQNDGDSVYRLFYDTVKGGDFRSREANVYRLAEVSVQHHRPVRGPGRAVRPRVRRPARQPLLRRRAGLAHLLRPRPDRPAAPARRLPGAGPPDRAGQRARCTRAPRCSTSWSSTAAPAASSRATS